MYSIVAPSSAAMAISCPSSCAVGCIGSLYTPRNGRQQDLRTRLSEERAGDAGRVTEQVA